MNYQPNASQINRQNRLVNGNKEFCGQEYHRQQETSNSKKKVFFIRRKISPSHSKISEDNQKSTITKENEIIKEKEGNNKQYKQNQPQQRGIDQNSPFLNYVKNKNRYNNPENNSRQNSYEAMHLTVNMQTTNQADPNQKVSRGQYYESQLQLIQKDIEFFRFELEMEKNKKSQLQKQLQKKHIQQENCIFGVYSCLNEIFLKENTTINNALDCCFSSLLDKRNFNNLIYKIQTKEINNISLSQVQIDMRFIFISLKLAFQKLLEQNQKLKKYQDLKKQNQNEVKDYVNQFKLLNKDIQTLKSENRNLLDKIQIFSEQKTLKNLQKQLEFQTSQNDRLKSVSVQTQEKRIRSPDGVVYKQRLKIFNNSLKNRQPQSSYRHYDRNSIDGPLKIESRLMIGSISKLKKQQLQVQTVKKQRFELFKNKRIFNDPKKKKENEKKVRKPTVPYLNHLVQSQTLIIDEKKIEAVEFDSKQSQILNKNQGNKSILRVHVPVHRGRSNSHQETSLSKGKLSSGSSLKNISSRVYSTYSLNPLNKYGQKRLCNQVNTKKVRKITRLSEQSQQLQQRIKQLMEQQKILMQKYKHLQELKVTKEIKKSRRIKTQFNNFKQRAV